MDRRLLSQLVASTMARIMASGLVPSLQQGTVSEEGANPLVLLDSSTPDVDAVSIPCRVSGDPPGTGERVLVVVAAGTGWVVGRLGGSVRLLGAVVATGNDDFTAAEVLDTMSLDVEVQQPGRVLMLEAQGLFSVDTNGASIIGRFRQDGTNVGRFATHTFPTASVGQLCNGFTFIFDPDPGGYVFDCTGEASGGTGTFAGATSAGRFRVSDIGNVGMVQ